MIKNIKRILRKIIRNFAYVWFSKEFKAIVIEEPIKINGIYKYKVRELGFDKEIFEINVSKKHYKYNDIICLGPKK